MRKVLILGEGRIGRAVEFFLKKLKITRDISFFDKKKNIKNFDLLIGALPGKISFFGLDLALWYKKDFVDISDEDEKFYLKRKKEIEKKQIKIIPCCGFCPGLVDFILTKEISEKKPIKEIEIKVGSLSFKKHFFPFLWSFEDLILEHQIYSLQKINGKIKKFPPFFGYQKERFFGIEAESYFSSSGFESLIKPKKIKNFKFRVVRPDGFFVFFQFLKNYNFFEKNNINFVKKIFERPKEKNITFAQIKIEEKRKIFWQIKSVSKANEELNSMQKVTALFSAIVAQFIFEKKIQKNGLIFFRDLANKNEIFKETISQMKKYIIIKRR